MRTLFFRDRENSLITKALGRHRSHKPS